MAGTYELGWQGKCLSFALHGMWDAATMARWDAAFRAAVAAAPGTPWTVLGDMSDYPPQSAEIQAGHEKLMSLSAEKGMVKTVLVVPKAVVAMQMKRMAGQTKMASVTVFADSLAEGKKLIAA